MNVCTYSPVQFTLRFVNLFIKVSRVCDVQAYVSRTNCWSSLLVATNKITANHYNFQSVMSYWLKKLEIDGRNFVINNF